MSSFVDPSEAEAWSCGKCGVALEMRKVEVAYRGASIPWNCPGVPVVASCLFRRTWLWAKWPKSRSSSRTSKGRPIITVTSRLFLGVFS